MVIKGQIISGKFGEIIARQKSTEEFQLGEIVVVEDNSTKSFLQVYDIVYASQLSRQNLELIAGIDLEENSSYQNLIDPHLRNYKLAYLKNLFSIKKNNSESSSAESLTKSLPQIFSNIREVEREDFSFFTQSKK